MTSISEQIIIQIIKHSGKGNDFLFKKTRQISNQAKHRPISKIELLKAYRNLIKKKKIKPNKALENFLQRRRVRTLSGVAIISVLTKFYPCPGKCIYCPQEKGMPKSYLSNEPAVMRAVLCKFDPYKQVQSRLKSLYATGHSTDKIELIIIGGTWSVLPKQYQTWFIKRCFQACNEYENIKEPFGFAQGRLQHKRTKTQIKNIKTTLANIQKTNERAKHRIVGLTLETRPDYIDEQEIKKMRQLGCTRVEIGVQSLDNSILKLNQRGHKVKETIKATKLLKDAGFKICYHVMPNLPGSTPTKDLNVFKRLFNEPEFQPDMLKIYPTVVVKGSKLYSQWRQGKYKPYTDKQLLNLLIKIKQIIPPYVRINRLIRDIPSISIEGGNKISNLREMVQKEAVKRGIPCRCIRCREIRDFRFMISDFRFKKVKYAASDGIEYFLSYEDVKNDKLLAFVRLRFPSQQDNKTFPELNGAAIIRELHTYGHLVPINRKQSQAVQHLGLGKKLMTQAEKIALKNGYQKMAVISGVGVREYYRKLGYKLEGTYMVKDLK